MFHSIIFGYVFTAASIMALDVSPAASSSPQTPEGFIGLVSVPDRVVDGSAVRVQYQCFEPCQLTVEVVVPTLPETDSVVFSRKWISRTPGVNRTRRVLLRLPQHILYQGEVLDVADLENVTVRAWLDHLVDGSAHGTYDNAMLKVYKVVQVDLSHPPTDCPSWGAHLMKLLGKDKTHQCPHESEVIDVLTFPLASTCERFGAIRRFQPFIDRDLERARLHAVTRPSATLSVWIYLLRWCCEDSCGIIHHIDRKNMYDSVLMQLTDTGNIIFQARVTGGKDEAFRSSVVLPLRKWIRLDCYIKDSKVLLDATWDGRTFSNDYQFQDSIHYDDTDGYFGIGGGKFIPGIKGYFGPFKYHRFGSKEVKNPLQPESTLRELDKTHQECQEIKAFTKAFLKAVTESRLLSEISRGVCVSHFTRLSRQFGDNTCPCTWTWETRLKYSTLYHFLQTRGEEIRTGSLGAKDLRSVLFEEGIDVDLIFNQEQNKITFKSPALLKAASCFGNHKASLLLATLHLSGMAHPVDQQLGHVYSLIGAAGDNRLALMHAGYKHSQGIDGFPKDLEMSCSYYSNMGAQSVIDGSRNHDNKQSTPEHIYLKSQEDLHSLTYDRSDILHFLKFKAERGDVEAQRYLGSMLYWGQHGFPKDMEAAVKWLERSAMRDPSAMYDYSILLMKGHGVKKNSTRGYKLLKRAAEMGSINALNGLGWYHGMVLNDHRNAVKYFEQAAQNGSDDGMYNLGIYHLSGQMPGSPGRNETAAFRYFLNASRLGHVAAAVEAAWYLSTGSLEGVSQDAEGAVIMLKKACEKNGHLGFLIKEALQAYLQGSWQEVFVKYVLAAETGLGLAQSNVAHLCEELNLGRDCQRRYHNYSILNYDPHPSALLKMGDYYCSSSEREDSLSSVGEAISMYGRAALAGSPQGMYNLAALAQQGHVLPPNIYDMFNVSRLVEQDVLVEKIFTRCVEIEEEEAVTPCSVALLGVQMGKAFRRMSQNGAQLLLVYASLLSAVVFPVILSLQSCLEQKAPSHRVVAPGPRSSSPVSPDGVNLNREGDGVMGGTNRAAGNLRLTVLNGRPWLRQTGDLVVTLSGVCLCAFWTTLLYHLL